MLADWVAIDIAVFRTTRGASSGPPSEQLWLVTALSVSSLKKRHTADITHARDAFFFGPILILIYNQLYTFLVCIIRFY